MNFETGKKLAVLGGIKSIGVERFDTWLIHTMFSYYSQDALFQERYSQFSDYERFHVGNTFYMIIYQSYNQRTVYGHYTLVHGTDAFDISTFGGYPKSQDIDELPPPDSNPVLATNNRTFTQYLNVENNTLVWSGIRGDEDEVMQKVMDFLGV
jgi:hypothetical protein